MGGFLLIYSTFGTKVGHVIYGAKRLVEAHRTSLKAG